MFLKASPLYQRVASPLQGKMVEVGGRIMGVNEVGAMVEVGGEVMEADEVGNEVPRVGATGLGATGFQGHGCGREPPSILGTTGVEAGRVDAYEEDKFVKRLGYLLRRK